MEREGEDYNTVQLRVFAGCSKFITMNGAPSILASYFGGENIIYTKTCREVRESGSFYGWYHLFGKNTHVRVVRSYEDLIERVDTLWANEPPPLLNILVRCHDRPGGIKRLLDSIDYPNYRVIASYDNQSTLKYIKLMPLTRVKVTPRPHRTPPPGEEYSISLPANEYLN